MPNWCSNTIVVSGEAVDISLFNEWLDDGKALLTKIKPTPQPLVDTVAGFHGDPDEQKKLEEQSAANKMQYGYANWYDWNIGNWGTKWDVDAQIDDISSSSEEVIMSFESAWSPPQRAIASMAEKFPNLKIRHSYLEEGCGFVGVDEYSGGGLDDEISYDDFNTEECKQLARDEFGWEPWEDDDDELEHNEESKATEVPKPAKKPAKKKVKKATEKKKPAKKSKPKAKKKKK